MTLHFEDDQLEIHKLVVGPYDNNVFVLRCKATGDAVLLDAANEHEKLLELAQSLNVRRVLETHGHWDHIQAVPAMREAGYEVAVTALDAPRLKDVGYDVFLDDKEVIEVGRVRLDAIHTPGHTEGSICFKVAGSPIAVQRRHPLPRRPRQHDLRGRRLRHHHPVDRQQAVHPARPTRSSCPATATTPPSAPSGPTSRSGSTGAGDQLIQAVPRKRRCISAARAVIQITSAAHTPTIPSEGCSKRQGDEGHVDRQRDHHGPPEEAHVARADEHAVEREGHRPRQQQHRQHDQAGRHPTRDRRVAAEHPSHERRERGQHDREPAADHDRQHQDPLPHPSGQLRVAGAQRLGHQGLGRDGEGVE